MTHTADYRCAVEWITTDKELIARIRRRFNMPFYTTVNGLTPAQIKHSDMDYFRLGEKKGLYRIISFNWLKNGDTYSFISR